MLDRDHKSLGFSTTTLICDTDELLMRPFNQAADWFEQACSGGVGTSSYWFSSPHSSIRPLWASTALSLRPSGLPSGHIGRSKTDNRITDYSLNSLEEEEVIIDSWQLLSVQVRLRLMKNCIVFYFLCCWTSVMFNLDGCKNSVCKSSTAVINWMTD